MDGSSFGKLVRVYREQRGWKQGELAERWGFTREYVSQIERGKRKLDKQEQVNRLADILGIPPERLEAVGKGMPAKRARANNPLESDDVLLQALLEPAQTTVKMSWLIWQGDNVIGDVGANLRDLQKRLNNALCLYRGQFHQPALRILAYTHEMLGKLAIERTATAEALKHFQEMYDIAEEVGDVDMLTLATLHQSEMLRRRGRHEAAFRRIEAAEKFSRDASRWLQGVFWKTYARNYYVYGDEQGFLRTIDRAEEIAEDTESTLDTLSNDFDKIGVLQERAQGHTMFLQPERALQIYQQTDRLRPFRPLRDQASYHIVKAQAYCYTGDITHGVRHAMTGLHMAEKIQSTRFVVRLQQMSDRLNVLPIGRERALKELRGEVFSTLRRLRPYGEE